MNNERRAATVVIVLLGSLCAQPTSAQGVLIQDATTNTLLQLQSSEFNVSVVDQVAIITSTQRFQNTTADTLYPKYGYPMPAAASATRLRWMPSDSLWYTASMVAAPQDTTLPGTGGGAGTDPDLEAYLGETPLYFRILNGIPPGTGISVELTYVELLPYANARVELTIANDYSPVYSAPVPAMTVYASVRSQRAITGIDLTGTGNWNPSPNILYVTADSAALHTDAVNIPANCGFAIGYDLDPLAYGLISMSNYLPDSLIKCDEMGNGFFALLIEPEPTSGVIPKDIVIIIDRSGSMSGNKIQEARDAASFMVNHLNVGDLFNVIAFDQNNIRWNNGLQPFNTANMTSALNWIASVSASGSTNINGALMEGIADYTGSDPTHAKPLVFLTDGVDSYLSNAQILSNVLQSRQSIVPELQLFTFGIGQGFNEQLLNQLAVQNNGVSQFLETANFAQVMGDFYTQIQNPVLLAPTATFNRPDILNTYPVPLMGLFVGQQMVIVGRYDVPGPVDLHLEGFASGQPVSFDYTIELSDSFDEDRLFIPKIWAQKAIQSLLNEYYTYSPGSSQAQMLEDSVSNYSMCYGIGSPFTSFTDPGTGGGGGVVGLEEETPTASGAFLLFPDPAPSGTPVTIDLGAFVGSSHVVLRVFDNMGRLVFEMDLSDHAGGSWTWDGRDRNGQELSGQFVLQLSDGTQMLTARCTKL